MTMIPAIVLSSHTAGLGVIRALGSKGVPIINVYYEKSDMGYVSKYVQKKIFAPHPEKNEKQFVELLIDLARKEGRGVLIPADDATLSVVSQNKKLLAKHHLVACADWSITGKLIDKKYTYELAEQIGIPAPKTCVPKSIEDLERYDASIHYPCLVKPCESHRYYEVFKRKMVKVENFDQLLSAYSESIDKGIEVMLQEYIPGDDRQGVNYNSYFSKGEPLVEFTAEKVRMSPPEFGVPSAVVSKEVPELREYGRRVLRAMGFSGYSCTEFKKDPRDGVYKLMEVNGRHNRSALLAVKCGINFPWIEYQYLVEGKIPVAAGYMQNVYWIDEFRDSFRFLGEMGKGRFPLSSQVRPYVNRNVFAVFDRRDPSPFLKHCSDLMGRIF